LSRVSRFAITGCDDDVNAVKEVLFELKKTFYYLENNSDYLHV